MGYPLPWNYYDMGTLCITEFAHNRIIGILGSIISVIEALIPPWHLPGVYLMFRAPFTGGGLSTNIIPSSSSQDTRHSRMSRKAMKIWNTALYYIVDARMWGIHHSVVSFLRMHMMTASRWFSSSHSCEDSWYIRTWLVGAERRLKGWRDPNNQNEQTRLLANRMWNTDNGKNVIPTHDMYSHPWGVVRSAMLLKYESFHTVSFPSSFPRPNPPTTPCCSFFFFT